MRTKSGHGAVRGWMVLAGACLAAAPAWAQGTAGADGWGTGRGLGLQPARAQVPIGCGASLLPCPAGQAFAARASESLRWNVELATVPLSPALRAAPAFGATPQGLNVSLMGSKPVFGSGFAVFGRVGALGALPTDHVGPSFSGLPDGHGLSFGAGVSFAFTPRLSATLGWDSYDLRWGAGPRETMRSTSLGLQYRY